MGLQHEAFESETLSTETRAVQRAYAWLARYSPLLDDPAELSADDCRERLELIPGVRTEGQKVAEGLVAATGDGVRVAETVRQALAQVDILEESFRTALNPPAATDSAAVDLHEFQSKMAEAVARQEVDELLPSLAGQKTLELDVSPGSLAGAAMMGVFALGWLSFTTVHAVLMIGSMFRAFGPLTLLLLAFYSIFFGAGGLMAYGAFRAGCREDLRMSGSVLTLRRRFGTLKWEKSFQIPEGGRASLTPAIVRQQGVPSMEISIKDAEGRDVRFGTGVAIGDQRALLRRLNTHLETVCP